MGCGGDRYICLISNVFLCGNWHSGPIKDRKYALLKQVAYLKVYQEIHQPVWWYRNNYL